MVTGRSELGRFGPGNPGRPRGALGKRRRIALEWFDQYNFDPLESKILLCQSLQQRLVADTFASEYERIEYHKLYSETLKDVLQYGYQRLKAVEHFGQLELVQKLQELESYTDDELRTLLAEAKEYARRHPSGGASCP
jgi:hypothetical protein